MAQALPPGWEARFDAGSGRYYFINHYTQSTSWVDPRNMVQPQAQPRPPVQQQPQRQTAYAGYSQPSAGYSQPSAGYSQPSAQPASQPSPRPAARPAARPSPSISRSSQESMPLRSVRHEQSPQPSTARQPQPSTARQETSFGDDDDSGLSEAEKKAMVRKLRDKLDLEGVNDDLVILTLQGVQYSESMATDVFRSMGFKGKGEAAAAAASTSSTDRWETTTARPKKKKKKEIVPSQPIRPSQPIPSVSDMSSETAITFDSNFDFSLKETSIGSRSVLDHMSADQSANLLSKMTASADVSSMFAKASSSSFDAFKSTSVTVPSSSINKLQQKIGSSGANKGLSRGSNPSLLSNQRTNTRGADRSLVVGPRKALAQGQSKLAKGQNRGIAVGADRNISVGRNLTLAKGTLRAPIAAV